MACSFREGVRAMKGMWKTLAERLGGGELVWVALFGRGCEDLPVAYDADVELFLRGHLDGVGCCW
jgi:hypothetical protein